jgi:hypothetical protein
VDPHCFDADLEPDPDPAQNLDVDADPDPDPDPGGGGGGRSAKNVHPPWQNPRDAPGWRYRRWIEGKKRDGGEKEGYNGEGEGYGDGDGDGRGVERGLRVQGRLETEEG